MRISGVCECTQLQPAQALNLGMTTHYLAHPESVDHTLAPTTSICPATTKLHRHGQGNMRIRGDCAQQADFALHLSVLGSDTHSNVRETECPWQFATTESGLWLFRFRVLNTGDFPVFKLKIGGLRKSETPNLDPQIVGSPDNKDPNKVPLISQTHILPRTP